MTAPGSFSFAVELLPNGNQATGATIGVLGLFRPPACGYLLDEPFWGYGYATEALKAFVQKYWEHFPEGAPGLQPEDRDLLLAHVHEGNVASENVLKKVGFRAIGQEVSKLDSGETVRATVFRIERPDKVPGPGQY